MHTLTVPGEPRSWARLLARHIATDEDMTLWARAFPWLPSDKEKCHLTGAGLGSCISIEEAPGIFKRTA